MSLFITLVQNSKKNHIFVAVSWNASQIKIKTYTCKFMKRLELILNRLYYYIGFIYLTQNYIRSQTKVSYINTFCNTKLH